MKCTADAIQHLFPDTTITNELPENKDKEASTSEQPTNSEVRKPGMSTRPSSFEVDAWSEASRLAHTVGKQAEEPHQEPHLHERAPASSTGVMPAIHAAQAAQSVLPAEEHSVALDLEDIPECERANALQETLDAHPAITSIIILDALPTDVYRICSDADLCAGLHHLELYLKRMTINDGCERRLAEQLLQLQALTSVKLNTMDCSIEMDNGIDNAIILQTLAASATLESIDLVGGYVSVDGARRACDSLSMGRLKTLAMSGFVNHIGGDDDCKCAVRVLLRWATNNLTLKRLSLHSYAFNTPTAPHLAALLKDNQTLELLNAQLIFKHPDEAQAVGDALASNTSVKSLALFIDFYHFEPTWSDSDEIAEDTANPGSNAPRYTPVAQGLAQNQVLQCVKLSFYRDDEDEDQTASITRDIGLLINAIGQHPCIAEAELDIANIGDIKDVLSLLQHSPRLRVLKIVDELPSLEIYEQIAQAIEKHPSLNTFELRLAEGDNLADAAATAWEINNARDIFNRIQLRIALALAQNQGYVLGANLNAMMEARTPTPGMLPTPPLEVSQLLMRHAMLMLPDADRQNVIDAFRL